MQVIQESQQYSIIRCSKGERFPQALESWISQTQRSFFFYAIGGAQALRVGYYRLNEKQYDFKEFPSQDYEILSLQGNIAYTEGAIKTHAHVSFSDSTCAAFGGHLDWLEVGGTLEIFLFSLPMLSRKIDEDTGLPLLTL